MPRMTEEEKRTHLINCLYDNPGSSGWSYAIINRFIVPEVHEMLHALCEEGVAINRPYPGPLRTASYHLTPKYQKQIASERRKEAREKVGEYLKEVDVDLNQTTLLVLQGRKVNDSNLTDGLDAIEHQVNELWKVHAFLRNLRGTIKESKKEGE